MILINGEKKQHIEASDRGFQYGDGLFETIEVRNGRPVFLSRHLQRMESGCKRLDIPFPGEQLDSEAWQLCRLCSGANAVLKIIVTRGAGGRGYRAPDSVNPTRVLSLHPFPHYPQIYALQGINVRFCSVRLGLNPALAGMKHLNRLEQVMARAEWTEPEIQEGLMLDIEDYVIEGTMTNLFYVRNNRLFTAELNRCGVAGIMRAAIMELAIEQGLKVIEHRFSKQELLSADEAFVCNSVVGIWPIRQIEDTRLALGPLTAGMQSRLEQHTNADC